MGVEARSGCCSRIRSCYSLHLDMRSLVRGAPRAGFAHDLRALRRRCAAVFVVSIIARLHRRARHGPVRAEHAAVSRLRTQHGLASLAFVEELAGLGRHDLPLCVTALGTRDHRFEEDFRHTLTPRSPNAHLQLSHRSGSFCIRGWHHGWLIAAGPGLLFIPRSCLRQGPGASPPPRRVPHAACARPSAVGFQSREPVRRVRLRALPRG